MKRRSLQEVGTQLSQPHEKDCAFPFPDSRQTDLMVTIMRSNFGGCEFAWACMCALSCVAHRHFDSVVPDRPSCHQGNIFLWSKFKIAWCMLRSCLRQPPTTALCTRNASVCIMYYSVSFNVRTALYLLLLPQLNVLRSTKTYSSTVDSSPSSTQYRYL